MRNTTRLSNWAAALGVAAILVFGSVQLGSARQANTKSTKTEKSVYVCSCMGDSSCPCMTMATKEGKCACGAHSPDMKKVAADSAWAKKNHKALQ